MKNHIIVLRRPWVDVNTGEIVAQKLYDHRESPVVTEDLSHNPKYKNILEAHSALLNAGWQGLRPVRARSIYE